MDDGFISPVLVGQSRHAIVANKTACSVVLKCCSDDQPNHTAQTTLVWYIARCRQLMAPFNLSTDTHYPEEYSSHLGGFALCKHCQQHFMRGLNCRDNSNRRQLHVDCQFQWNCHQGQWYWFMVVVKMMIHRRSTLWSCLLMSEVCLLASRFGQDKNDHQHSC